MKISLSWLFDFIDHPISRVNVDELVHLFNIRTAEIEHYEKVELDVESMFLGRVIKSNAKNIVVLCKELDKEFELSVRTDAQLNSLYLIKKVKGSYKWVTLADFHSDKDGLFPAVSVDVQDEKKNWRKHIESTDYILDIDNKSINHRPDLWGHYGIAREVAAFFDFPLKSLQAAQQKIIEAARSSKVSEQASIAIKVDDTKGCARFAGLYCDQVDHKASCLFTATRLLRVGAKPIDMMVDLTNYVMFDVGHPMHVFDAMSFSKKQLVVRKAQVAEELTILDGQELKLRAEDLVIANDKHPVALAGVMGGCSSGYSEKTKSVFLEAAGFDPTMIRKTAQHFKLRTEASVRFEKHLDPMSNIAVLQRFVYLAQRSGLLGRVKESIVSVGTIVQPKKFEITHQFIEQRLGSSIEESFVKNVLKKLHFVVSSKKTKNAVMYSVTVPTSRTTKDIEVAEDILEEIVRMYGYEHISYQPLQRDALPFKTTAIDNVSRIKRELAYGLHMHEVRDYLFYDESFIKQLKLETPKAITVKNPVSENWLKLVTSLVPHLLKSVALNVTKHSHVRFFEWNHVWPEGTKKDKEVSSLAGIIFDVKAVNFYDTKAELQGLWDLLGVDVTWRKPKGKIASWYDQHKTAELFVGKQCIGVAGIASQEFIHPVLQGEAFIFELDGSYLEEYEKPQVMFESWSKYQDVTYDISLLVPLQVTAGELKQAIGKASSKINAVELVDFFEKDDWDNQRSLTFRYTMSDHTKTLDKNEIDAIVQKVEKVVKKYDAKIR